MESDVVATTPVALDSLQDKMLEYRTARPVSKMLWQLAAKPKTIPEVKGIEVFPDQFENGDGQQVSGLGHPCITLYELDAQTVGRSDTRIG